MFIARRFFNQVVNDKRCDLSAGQDGVAWVFPNKTKNPVIDCKKASQNDYDIKAQ